MGQGLGRSDVCQPFLRPAPERAARRGQHQRLERLRGSALQALLQRRVLAVDRQQQTAAAAHGGGHQLAARHQALLVGEGQVAAGVERRHRGLEPGGADDRVQHDVGSERAHQLHHAVLPAQHPAVEFRTCAFGGGGVGQRDRVSAVLARSRHHLGVRSVRGQAGETQVRVVANDLERVRRREPGFVKIDAHLRVDREDAVAGGVQFGPADVRRAVHHLPLKVAEINQVEIDQSDPPHARRREIEPKRRA